jgi:hypothetical protein
VKHVFSALIIGATFAAAQANAACDYPVAPGKFPDGSQATKEEMLAAKGLVISGTSPDKRLVEMVELKDHPFFVGCQFHPEFKSRPMSPHPIFAGFVGAALEKSLSRGRSRTGDTSESRAVN